jgi:glucosamine--fructose-6-phosphate aminotransferase (isomerizing)
MCGIIAYLRKQVSQQKDGAFQKLYQGLLQVQNRGYDSAGVASIVNGSELKVNKYASQYQTSALNLLKNCEIEYEGCHIGIAHTRWATHGGKTDQNAHPHLDYYGDFALVHNGIIENYLELKNFLKENGYVFKSETDSEVIVNLISYYYRINVDNIESAINQAIGRLHGTWALAIICRQTPSTLYLCKNGSPLLLGFSDDELMVASEVAGFCNVVKQYIILANHDVISVNFENLGYMEQYHVHDLGEQKLDLSPHPYPHWMIKEIEEQPQSILRALNMGGRIESDLRVKLGGLDKIADRLSKIENLVVLACGTSYHAGLFGASWIRKLQCFNTVTVIDASEFQLSDLPQSNVGVVLISQSGETKDVHLAMELIRDKDGVMIVKKSPKLLQIVNTIVALFWVEEAYIQLL